MIFNCTRCGREKRHYARNMCMSCYNYCRYLRHPESIKKAQSKFKKRNPTYMRDKQREFRERNPSYFRDLQREKNGTKEENFRV